MPVSAPAHQAFVLPLKIRWPHLFDATALSVGAASPDLAFAFGPTLRQLSHSWLGLLLFCIPVTMTIAGLLRWRCAERLFPQLPDIGSLKLKSLAVITNRRPPVLVTATSAALGAASHIFVDSFTHSGRWGSNLLGLNRVIATIPIRGDVSIARILQYLGHTIGSAIGLGLFVLIASRHLRTWYGQPALTRARALKPQPVHRLLFWSNFAIVSGVGTHQLSRWGFSEFTVISASVIALLFASLALPTPDNLPVHADENPEPERS